MGYRIIYLIRNGQYDREAVDPQTNIGASLTEIGREQAAITAKAIRDLPIVAASCSPYQQIVETAQILVQPFEGFEAKETHLLREYDLLLQMLDERDHRDIVRFMAVNREAQLDLAFATFFKPSPEDEIQEFIVCHDNIIRNLICRAVGVSPETWMHMMINNCGISCVLIHPDGKMEVTAFNDTKHLPEHLKTWG